MKKVVVWLSSVASVGVIALSLPLASCSSGGSCTYVSKCPNDSPTTEAAITLCNNRKNDAQCGGQFSDYLGCVQANQTCTTSGTTDETITNGTCGDHYAKWQNCFYGTDGSAHDASGE